MEKDKNHSAGEKVTWIGIIINLILAALKLAAGVLGRSEALIADAAHSLSDLLSDFIVLASLKIAKRPLDEARPYGYGKVETVGTGVLGFILIAAGIMIFWKSILTIRSGISYTPSYIALVGAMASIITKELLYQYTVKVGRKTGSPSVVANAWHHRSDALSSVATFIGVGAAMYGWPLFDPIAAITVTALIVKAGWDISAESFKDLIDTSVNKEVRDAILEEAKGTNGALDCHDLKTRKSGSNILVDIHIEVSPSMNVMEAHSVADNVRDRIIERIKNVSQVLVHVDPQGERDGIIYSSENEAMTALVRDKITGTYGIEGCKNLRLYGAGEKLAVHMELQILPELTIKEGYAAIAEIKNKILSIEGIVDAIISIDLPGEGKERND